MRGAVLTESCFGAVSDTGGRAELWVSMQVITWEPHLAFVRVRPSPTGAAAIHTTLLRGGGACNYYYYYSECGLGKQLQHRRSRAPWP